MGNFTKQEFNILLWKLRTQGTPVRDCHLCRHMIITRERYCTKFPACPGDEAHNWAATAQACKLFSIGSNRLLYEDVGKKPVTDVVLNIIAESLKKRGHV